MRYLNPKYALNFSIVFLLMTNSLLFAHGALTARITEVTTQISKDPTNSELYFKRGVLYYQHLEFHKALEDYKKSEKLGNTKKNLFYYRALTYQKVEDYNNSLSAIETYFKIDSKIAKINKLRGQVLASMGRYEEALFYYDYAIKNAVELQPEEILEFCDIILAKNPSNYSDALIPVEYGLEKLGQNSAVLLGRKIDYLKRLNDTEKVIDEYNDLIIRSKRKEKWYYEKAMYLKELHKNTEAMVSLQQAKFSIQQLHPKFQQTPTIKRLSTKIIELEKTLL